MTNRRAALILGFWWGLTLVMLLPWTPTPLRVASAVIVLGAWLISIVMHVITWFRYTERPSPATDPDLDDVPYVDRSGKTHRRDDL